jgi:hypothetical protein
VAPQFRNRLPPMASSVSKLHGRILIASRSMAPIISSSY